MPDMQHLMQEEFRVIFLNTKNGIIAERTISKGTLNATVVSPREVFHRAVKLMCCLHFGSQPSEWRDYAE